MQQINSIAGDSVTTLLFRHLGRDDDLMEERAHALNPELAGLGPILPAGVPIILPDLPPQATKKVVQIWD